MFENKADRPAAFFEAGVKTHEEGVMPCEFDWDAVKVKDDGGFEWACEYVPVTDNGLSAGLKLIVSDQTL